MILYQRIVVSTGAHVGEPGTLDAHIAGFADTPAGLAILANLPAALSAATITQLGLADTGFLPVEEADPTPPAPRTIARIDFMRRFTTPEQVAIQASEDPVVKNVLFMLTVIDAVELDNADTQGGVNYLESTSPPLIAAGRAAQILS